MFHQPGRRGSRPGFLKATQCSILIRNRWQLRSSTRPRCGRSARSQKPGSKTVVGDMPIHTQPNCGQSVDWLTPPWIVESLGEFDLDPCASAGQFYQTAKRMVSPPVDGLSQDWSGRVWLNPPYGTKNLIRWLGRMAAHSNGIALIPARTEVEAWFWPHVWNSATAILFIRGRIHFRLPGDAKTLPNGKRPGNAGHGSVLAAYGQQNAAALSNSGISGRFFLLQD